MHILVIVLLILAVLLVLGMALSLYLARFALGIKAQSLSDARRWQEEHYDLSWYDGLEKKDYVVPSDDGYQLHVQYLANPSPSDRFIILSHGYTDNRFGALKYGKIYLDLGFNLIIYDLRGHGENEHTFCSYSIRESVDLDVLVEETRLRYPHLTCLGLHGESLGAATSVACLKYFPPVDFVVADCAFARIAPILEAGLRSMKLPTCLLRSASLAAKIRYGYAFSEMSPIDSLAENQVPLLFIHGADDTFISPENSEEMAKADPGYHELFLVPGAAHAQSVLTDPEGYAKAVSSFLASISQLRTQAPEEAAAQASGDLVP